MTSRRNFTVIGHRGAPGYLPEHTLEGVSMAHTMGVDFIELDAVLTRDNTLIVLHDLYLETMTDVAGLFPGRERNDGHFYAIDFSLEEIRMLRMHERTLPDGRAEFPARFPHADAIFRIPTLAEEITLVQGLNHSRGKEAGIYIEPKSPAWHSEEGRDITGEVIEALAQFGYRSRQDKAILQSFDFDSIQRARTELKSDLKLVQLIGENSWRESSSDFDLLQTAEGLAAIAEFADGIGPWLMQVVRMGGEGKPEFSGLVDRAHAAGLFVHAYTLRADQLPDNLPGMSAAVELLLSHSGLDGIFTDHPDQVIRYRNG